MSSPNSQLNALVTELRNKVRARDGELACKAAALGELQADLAEKDAKLARCEAIREQKEETIAVRTPGTHRALSYTNRLLRSSVQSLTTDIVRLEQEVADLRKDVDSRNADLCHNRDVIVALEKKYTEKEQAMCRAVGERDAARAKKANFGKSKAKIARMTSVSTSRRALRVQERAHYHC